MKAAFAKSAKYPANTAFAARAAITAAAAVVVVKGKVLVLTSCDPGGDGSGSGRCILRLDCCARRTALPHERRFVESEVMAVVM